MLLCNARLHISCLGPSARRARRRCAWACLCMCICLGETSEVAIHMIVRGCSPVHARATTVATATTTRSAGAAAQAHRTATATTIARPHMHHTCLRICICLGETSQTEMRMGLLVHVLLPRRGERGGDPHGCAWLLARACACYHCRYTTATTRRRGYCSKVTTTRLTATTTTRPHMHHTLLLGVLHTRRTRHAYLMPGNNIAASTWFVCTSQPARRQHSRSPNKERRRTSRPRKYPSPGCLDAVLSCHVFIAKRT
jgi:hypothetical protein